MFDYLILSTSLMAIAILLMLRLRMKLPKIQLFLVLAGILVISMLIFDTYLTHLPIVEYNSNSILGVHIGTIPIEDFGYLIAVILLVPGLYEYFTSHEKDQKK